MSTLPEAVDVLVVGFGTAGAAAAIAAHDAGASVQIVEKTAAGGGNCLHSGGFLFEVGGPHAVDHLDALCFGKTDRKVLEAFAAGLPQVPQFLAAIGGETVVLDPARFGGLIPSWPSFPAAGDVHYRQFVPGPGERPGVAMWRTLEQAVRDRGIQVALGSGVNELICEDGRVTGAVVDGQTVKASGGVVLASGSFEADPELSDTYLSLPLISVGHAGNTGDTIRLAQSVGASLWHMSAYFGWLSFKHPDHEAGFTLDVHAPSYILVDGDGNRFTDETGWEVHDTLRCLTNYSPHHRNRPRLPGWIIFDEAARLAGPLHGIVGTPNDYRWSADNIDEVAAGWIRRGEDASSLAAATGLDPLTLGTTLAEYAASVRSGHDQLFARDPASLVDLQAPLYAIPFVPGVATASGGPRRDASARVVASDGEPIEGLYAAGAAGSVWAHLTEHGGGLTDAIVFGRIAGAHAAASVPAAASSAQ